MQIGDKWLRAQTSAVLEVPSVIVTSESDFLLSRGRRVDFENVWDSRSRGLPLFPNTSWAVLRPDWERARDRGIAHEVEDLFSVNSGGAIRRDGGR